jgi:hypothetical protein
VTIRLAAAALAATTLLVASPARAQTPTGGAYLTARLGAFSPTHSDLGRLNTGFDGELGLGYRFGRYLGVEGAVGYYRAAGEPHAPVLGPGVTEGEAILSVIPVTATLRALLPFDRAEFFALGGAGFYFANMDVRWTYSNLTPDNATMMQSAWSASDTTLGVHAGAGFDVHLASGVLLGADLRYVFASAKFVGMTTHNIGGLRLGAVLGYRF